ncbi:uracil-DNA glycosylase [Nocardioides sp. LHG3406-4]|uniref:uracil-DNA glycosylase n=1 Tax=Nocardioides sp. LHG3406-4 TaxID=2804575 RepID=UPI003CF1EACF
MTVDLPHPITGQLFGSPVPPGTGWPEDPAAPGTPVARTAAGVRRLAATPDLAELDARVSVCSACPRLVRWREDVARDKRASFADQPYWGRPIAGWGAADPRVLVVGLAPAANGGNRTGRVFTGDSSGDWLFASLHRVGLATQPTSVHAGDGQRLVGARMVATVRCAPPANKPTPDERDACAPWINREVGLLAPGLRAVVALGAYGWDGALRALAGAGLEVPRPKPRFGHGVEVPIGHVTLIGCYHPSQHNTFTGRLTPAMLDDVLGRARALAG